MELYNSDGAVGAARAAGFGCGYYQQFSECFRGMEIIHQVDPVEKDAFGSGKFMRNGKGSGKQFTTQATDDNKLKINAWAS